MVIASSLWFIFHTFELDSGRICDNCIFRDVSRHLVTVSFKSFFYVCEYKAEILCIVHVHVRYCVLSKLTSGLLEGRLELGYIKMLRKVNSL